MTPLNRPNLFILGAAKCGTTSLHDWLNQHPQIFMSAIKEPSFYCSLFQVVNNEKAYFKLFDQSKDELYRGESSHAYLTDPSVPEVLSRLYPHAKFILILRNPADRAHSLYLHMKRHLHEHAPTFEKALQMEPNRINEDFMESNGQYYHNFLYFNSGLYGRQINRYLSYYRKDQFLFLHHSELQTPEILMKKITQFLSLDCYPSYDFSRLNTGYTIRFRFVEKLLWSRYLTKGILHHLGFQSLLKRFNHISPSPIKPETRHKLMIQYKDDLKEVKRITGLEL